MKERYFGSTRFFKNLILLAVIILIAVPTVLALRYHKEVRNLTEDLAAFTLLSADGASYQALYPDFVSGADAADAVETAEKTVYLTFTGGPSADTETILNALSKEKVKATFFVTKRAGTEKELKAIARDGHTIGIYTSSQDLNTMYNSVEEFLADLYECFTWVQETTGQTPAVFRMPGGSVNSYNLGLYREMIAEMLRRGFVPYDWNVSGQDAAGIGTKGDAVAASVIEGVRKEGRAIVALHDGLGQSAAADAIPQIVSTLQADGYQFRKLTEQVKPILFTYR